MAYDRGSNLNCQKILRPHKTVVLQTSRGPLLSMFSLHFPSNFQTFFFVQFFICTSVCLLSADFLICKLTNPNGVGAWPSRSRTCCSLPDLRGNVFAQENWILCLILILFLTLWDKWQLTCCFSGLLFFPVSLIVSSSSSTNPRGEGARPSAVHDELVFVFAGDLQKYFVIVCTFLFITCLQHMM